MSELLVPANHTIINCANVGAEKAKSAKAAPPCHTTHLITQRPAFICPYSASERRYLCGYFLALSVASP